MRGGIKKKKRLMLTAIHTTHCGEIVRELNTIRRFFFRVNPCGDGRTNQK
jgi:hypothetical protein